MSEALVPALREWLARGEACVLVTVAATCGSTPREAGASMLVSAANRLGTVGGGKLELDAIAAARDLIGSARQEATLDIALGPATGQCCGGHVVLRLERATVGTAAELAAREAFVRAAEPALFLFGAGHVGRALAQAFSPLPFRVAWIDQRRDEFPRTIPARVATIVTDHPLDQVASAPASSGFLVLTHSHALDFDLVEAILKRRDALYVGLIGSATKRRRFERWYRARGGDAVDLGDLVCPIGAGLPDEKRPELIAAMTAAELLVTVASRLAPAATRVLPSAVPQTRSDIGHAIPA